MADLETRPYTGPGDDTLPASVKALPDHAKAIWVAAFNSAWDSWSADKTDQPQEGYAFAVAWAAVKNLYKKDAEGNWTKRSLIEGDGHFTKVWRSADGVARWRATVMDDGVDQYATRMTIEFQDDVCARSAIEGQPWLGIAHFGRQSQIGETTRLYRDGRMVKAEGTFLTDSADLAQAGLARAAYEAATKEADLLPAHRSIAVSQAFYPEAHAIEDCGVVAFTRGRIEHIALTTRKANSRCDFGVEEGDAMRRSKTRRELRQEDAAAIVGEDLARALADAETEHRTVEQDDLLYRTAEEDGATEVSADAGETWEDFGAYLERATTPFADLPIGDRKAPYQEAEVLPRVRAWASSDGSGDKDKMDWPKFSKAFFWKDSATPEEYGSYKLKFADVVDGTLTGIPRGIFLAAAVMQGARGGVIIPDADRAGVKNHIARYYTKMAKEFNDDGIIPPWEQKQASLLDTSETEVEEVAEVMSEPDNVGPDSGQQASDSPEEPPEDRAGRRVRGEMLAKVADAMKQFSGAADAIKEFVTWASENLPAESAGPPHQELPPETDYRAAVAERWGMEAGAEPGDSVIGAMNEQQLTETAYHAGYTFLDIVVANITADPAELGQQERLVNVQNALNEFGQIIASIISQAAQPRSSESEGGTEEGVKSDGEGEAPVKPSGEPDSEAEAAVTDTLDQIRAALGKGADAGEMQVLLDQLAHRMSQCIEVPPPSLEEALQQLQAPILERLQAIEDSLADRSNGQERAPDGLGAPPRRKGFRPRLDAPTLRGADVDRPTERGYTPEQFARGAHRRPAFNPYV